MSAHNTVKLRLSSESCSSKLLYCSHGVFLQSRLVLKTVASPPPFPVVRGELKKEHAGGRSSEKGKHSPG